MSVCLSRTGLKSDRGMRSRLTTLRCVPVKLFMAKQLRFCLRYAAFGETAVWRMFDRARKLANKEQTSYQTDEI